MPTLMKTLSKITPEVGATMIDRELPTIGDDDILVKTLAASICGTDVHIYEYNDWAKSRIPLPQIMGHELAGQVIAKGRNVTDIHIGDIVSAETHIVCGTCEFCVSGNAHICQNTQIIGVDRDGAFAEYIALPAKNAWVNDPNVDPAFLCIQEPLGNAIHTVLSGETEGKTIAVVGCGPIGIMAIDVANAVGARRVFAIDVNDYRLDLAKKLGADFAYNPKHADVIAEILKETDGMGVDVVCEMSGSPIAFNQALKYLKKGGRMSVLGLPDAPFAIDVANDIVFKGITIHGITGRRMMRTWQQGKELIDSGKLHLSDIVTHIFPFENYEEGFALMRQGNCGKVVLRIGEKENL